MANHPKKIPKKVCYFKNNAYICSPNEEEIYFTCGCGEMVDTLL